MSYFSPYGHSRNKIEAELDCLMMQQSTNATGVDTSQFAKKDDLANLESEVDKLDIDKLEKVPSGLCNLKSKVDKLDVDKLAPVPTDLSKLSDLVKKKVVKKDVYDELVKKCY